MLRKLTSGKLSIRILSMVTAIAMMLSGFVTVTASESQASTEVPTTVAEFVYGGENTADAGEGSLELQSEGSGGGSAVTQSVYAISGIVLTPGKNASELNFAWYSESGSANCVVQIAKKADMSGTEFPESIADTFNGAVSDGVTGFSSNKVIVTGIEESTQYVYRLGDGVNWSPVYNYTSRKTDEYSFLFVGDPQIGSSNVTADTAGWEDTMGKAVNTFPEVSFLVSAGDQVNTATDETEYDGFFAPEELRSLPVASVQGNHDNAANYTYHFNNPNESTEYGITSAGGDYYYTYGDTLFIGLNSNNTSGASHAAFMEAAVAANPNAKWKMVVFHHSIYSSASHSAESSIVSRRAALFPVFDELGIDVVLMGHDHCYTRSHQMKGDQPILDQPMDENGSAINPMGILYITANSGSGSKYYTLKSIPEEYAAVREQLRVPTFSHISVTEDSLTISTYRTDTMEMTDTHSLIKDSTYTTDYEINNPYETVNWSTFGQYKADFHAHSVESDGADEPADMIEEHYSKGYDILAMTDHNFVSTTWDRSDRPERTYLTSERAAQMNAGTDRNGRGMIGIPYSDEQSRSDHVNTFWANFNNESGATLEGNIAQCETLGGISHINHPGRYTGGSSTANDGADGKAASNDLHNVAKYVNLFRKYSSCVGMEIINKKDGDSYSDRILWDNILKQTMPERPVWGFSNDDTHALANTGFSYNIMLMPENTLENVRNSMENGTFYAVAKVAKRELGSDFTANGPTPKITNIVVDQQENSIAIEGENYTTIEWIADGEIIAAGNTIDLNDHEQEISTYIRAQLKGDGGISFTQPFGIVGGYQPEPQLSQVTLTADGEELAADGSIQLEIAGQDEFYADMDLSSATVTYKTDVADVLSITQGGTVTLANAPIANMPVKVWAEVNLNGKTVISDKVAIQVEGQSEDHYIMAQITDGSDDYEENVSTGEMDDGSSDLEIVTEKANQLIGTRFANLSIPKGAKIIDAYIQFTVDEPDKSADPFNVNIHAEAVPNSPVFTNTAYNISSRTNTTSVVNWKDIPMWTQAQVAGEDQRTPNLAALVQEVVDMEGWNEGNAISFIFSGTGTRSAESYEGGGAAEAPTLHVVYELESNYIMARIQNSMDDMEERADGSLDYDSSDLEIVDEDSNQLIGIRFADLSIPKGSEIVNAYIQFTVDEVSDKKNKDPFNITIQAEDTANSAGFANENFTVSSRTRTQTAVTWSGIPKWTEVQAAGEDQRTPNLASLVQEIVDKDGWNAGNALSFILSGTGARCAESYEGGGQEQAPTLHVVYKDGEDQTQPQPAPSVKVHTKNQLVIKEDTNEIEYYFAITDVESLNTLDVTFSFDSSIMTFKKAEWPASEGTVIDAAVEDNKVRIVAGSVTPVSAAQYEDVLKLTFELADLQSGVTQAVLRIEKPITASAGVNEEITSNIDAAEAAVTVRAYKIICDIIKDGKLGSSDLSKALEYFMADSNDQNWSGDAERADVNFDGVVNITDFSIIIANILR
ncbi:metallophosphoesterase [Petroclostridium sp. X23]|uniref:metallophosphoesterase n=1 Tax=Petroclostridium sp. X23 TaxID=3045146 RepID=UPI0024AE47B2|nr:metallophosphoesterase [Petroclostridium sp. X23]WHH58241.1 metallophosphoesterase [Petroclostridium sp. X23]